MEALQPHFEVAFRRIQAVQHMLESIRGYPVLAAQRAGSAGGLLQSVLSPREFAVARLVAAGMTNEEIATKLYKSVDTVKSQVAAVLRKLKLNRRAELACMWHGHSTLC